MISIFCARRRVKRFLIIFSSFLFFSACNYAEVKSAVNNVENFFWVEIDQEDVRSNYDVTRLTVVDAEGSQLVCATGPLDGKFKIIPTESTGSEEDGEGGIRVLVELSALESQGSKIELIMQNEMARGYLESRFYEEVVTSMPKPGETITIKLEKKNLKIGYGEGGIKVSSIPMMPDFFKIDLNLEDVSSLISKGYDPFLAVVPAKDKDGKDVGLAGVLDLTRDPPVTQSGLIGISSPDTGWYMLANDGVKPGPCRYWILFALNNDYSTLRVYYHDGEIPQSGGTVDIEVEFAGIPVPNAAAFVVMAQPDAARLPTQYSDLTESYVLIAPEYDLSTINPWIPIGRDPTDNEKQLVEYSAFEGKLYGGSYKIRNVNLTGDAVGYHGYRYQGLFGFSNGAEFYDFWVYTNAPPLVFDKDTGQFDAFEATATGILVGCAHGGKFEKIATLHDSGKLQTNRTDGNGPNYAGGIIGWFKGDVDVAINDCFGTYSEASGGNQNNDNDNDFPDGIIYGKKN
ncbi:MAG: hypothetical protein LBC53_06540 [Spirochaetaceae bacterium]|jgi:hypothetical protein|nr:hypothetical protein [Spirochaetaceae bacterium]